MKMVASRASRACSKERITARLDLESRLPVGSSARISSGRLMRARATAVRCFSPPEISAGYLPRMWPMPNTSHSWSARSSTWEFTEPPMMAGRRMFSRTVRPSSSRKSWNTKPSCRLRTWARASSPRWASSVLPKVICPLSAGM